MADLNPENLTVRTKEYYSDLKQIIKKDCLYRDTTGFLKPYMSELVMQAYVNMRLELESIGLKNVLISDIHAVVMESSHMQELLLKTIESQKQLSKAEAV
ncbi:MAG: hypothetical protein AAF969_15390 [Bacteroidota bacterium]